MDRLTKEGKSKAIAECIGKTFGKLTVTRFVSYRYTPRGGSRTPIVECLCECGRIKDRSVPAFNNIYNNSYRGRALKAGLEFDIAKEAFRVLTQEDCHYCGSPPSSSSYKSNSGKRGVCPSGATESQYIYNGLDRVDSSKGYTLDNVVPCCGICNHAKHTMSYEQFTAWLDRVTAFRGKK